MQKKAFLLAAAALLALGARPAEAQVHRVRCESRDYRERLCRTDTYGGVRLVRRLGDASCREGRTWGTTRTGIWVSNGCRADFEVGRGRGGGILDTWRGRTGDWDRDRDRDRDGDWDRDGGWDRRLGSPEMRCRAAVASRLGTRSSNVNTWSRGRRGSNIELGWRAGRSDGTCRISRSGHVSVHVDRDSDRGRGRYN
ncbi:MAG: DUF3011 domain-containing protein [Longimicrobiaceae bacterium]